MPDPKDHPGLIPLGDGWDLPALPVEGRGSEGTVMADGGRRGGDPSGVGA